MKSPPLHILHIVGADDDTGGVLSVIRGLQSATTDTCRHSVLVNAAFRQTRQPTLDLRVARHLLMETPHVTEFLVRGWRGFLELRQLLQYESFDVLHAHARGPLVVSLLTATFLRRRVLHTIHAHARRTTLYRLAARHPRIHTILLTPAMATHYGIPPRQGHVDIVSACCNDSFFNAPLPPSSPAIPADDRPVRIAGIGNLVRWKKWDLLVDAVSRLTPFHRSRIQIDLWGPTPSDPDATRYAGELHTRIHQHRLEEVVHLRGPTLQVADIIRHADWFVLPSTGEPCSVALIEALALGTPALVASSGGNVNIVEDGATGLLFTPDSTDSLATQLARIADGLTLRASRSERRESVRPRSATAVAARYLESYRELARTPPPNRR